MAKDESPDLRCGMCKHYRANLQMLGMGQCWWGPPQMLAIVQNGAPGLIPVRPAIAFSTPACGQWAPAPSKSKPDPSASEVKSKLAPSQIEGSLK